MRHITAALCLLALPALAGEPTIDIRLTPDAAKAPVVVCLKAKDGGLLCVTFQEYQEAMARQDKGPAESL